MTNIFKIIKKALPLAEQQPDNTVKYLVAGLGNVGKKYEHTRHNIGFDILDSLAEKEGIEFDDRRYGSVAEYKFKGRNFVLLKPSTYVNLSGRAVNYWMKKEKIPTDRLLVVVDDLALPFGTLRLKASGSDGGHNGLKSINQVLGHNQYARLRFGIGDNYPRGHQVEYVLGKWSPGEQAALPERIDKAIDIIRAFGTIGLAQTMSQYNNR
ncbi:aminoacyl-tRNA hydrolase [Anaerophaga thermohalophila]|uniref:aminoacyl-tRNA hydrolase n=1 Tax=Anaerophaga thermohalophila TaxID=177400 RepID=UPI000237CE49|nr:aminoacyl-tRNA hydrolase [Anaerophaga thermohalophila]